MAYPRSLPDLTCGAINRWKDENFLETDANKGLLQEFGEDFVSAGVLVQRELEESDLGVS
jgi:hypothetical protein